MNKKVWVWLAVFLLLGAIPRIPQTFYGLPAAQYCDSFKTVGVAEQLTDSWRQGRWTLDSDASQYLTFYPCLLGVIYWAIGEDSEGEFPARGVAALAGLLSAVPVCLLCAEISGPLAALAGAGLVAFGFLFIQQGRTPISDPLLQFWVGMALYFLLRKEKISLRDILFSGLCAGLATGTKYTALIFLAPAVVARLCWNRPPMGLSFKGLWLWLGGCAAGFLAVVPMFIPLFRLFFKRMAIESVVQKSGPLGFQPASPFNYLFSSRVTPDVPPFANSLAGMMGQAFVFFALAALLWAAWRGWRDKDPRRAALFLSGIFSFAFFSTYSRSQAIRLLFPWVLMLAIIVALLIVDLSRWGSQKLSTLSHWRIRPVWFALLLELGLLLPSFGRTANYLVMLSRPDTRLLAARWICSHVPKGQKIFMFMWGPALPSGDYEIMGSHYPEYWFQIDDTRKQTTQFKNLVDQGVSWVVWDSFYTKRLISPFSTRGSSYFQKWRDFYSDIRRSCRKVFEAHGELSPDIEIYQLPPHDR
jgi:hypothetical protein